MDLSESIGELINALGGGAPPSTPEIKARLIDFRAHAQTLEDVKSSMELDFEKATLNALIGELETKLEDAKAQRQKIENDLESANSEIERMRAEKTKRDERRPAIEEKILLILKLGSRNDEPASKIAQAAGLSEDRTRLNLKRLKTDGELAQNILYTDGRPIGWYRTDEGNEYLDKHKLLE